MVLKRLPITLLCALLLLALPVFALAGGSQSESGKTLNDIEDYVEYLVDEDPYFTSGQVLSYINAAIQDVIWQTRCMESTAQLAVTAGVTEYDTGVSFFHISDVSWLESGATTPKPLLRHTSKVQAIRGEQKPAWYYVRAGLLGIHPVEDPGISGSSLYVTYLPVQDTLTGTQNVPTPAALDQALVYYAAARCFFRDKQFVAYQQMMSLYAQYIRRYRLSIGEPAPESKVQQ